METQEIFTLLNGTVKMYRSSYNPTSDAVWLAAMAPTRPENILDVGVGSGGVSLCLHRHFPNTPIMGIDISDEMLAVCERNAELNRFKIELMNQDILTWSTPRTFDLVVTNPPYFKGSAKKKNPQAHHNADLSHWIRRCIARVRPGGHFCTIIDAARLGEVLAVIGKSFGNINIIPLFGTKPIAERVLISARACSYGPSVIHIGFPMNHNPVLRDGLTIKKILSNIKP